jgi:hypothetical protein
MLPYTAYDVVRMVNHEIDLERNPVREFNHAFGDDSAPRSGRSGGGGGRGLFSSVLAVLAWRPRSAQVAPRPLS